MTTREREIEAALEACLRREGFKIAKAGDTFAEIGGSCLMAQIGEDRCESMVAKQINLTTLAKNIIAEIL